MALNFTVSYTFSPSTTISSSQVNTNTNDVASVFQGLEAETKTLAKLKVDVDPALALEVATKQYVDHYANYRRPLLVYASATTVSLETALDGTTGACRIQFPDGTIRSDSTASHIVLDVSRVASTSGSKQSGIYTGTIAASTWQAIYAVKATDNTTDFVLIAAAIQHAPGNFALINGYFGSNSWVYLGTLPYGDNSGATTAFPKFVQEGNTTVFYNSCGGGIQNCVGINLLGGTGVTTLTLTNTGGTGLPNIPSNILLGRYICTIGALTGNAFKVLKQDTSATICSIETSSVLAVSIPVNAVLLADGLFLANAGGSSTNYDVFLNAYTDRCLGVGSNPMF